MDETIHPEEKALAVIIALFGNKSENILQKSEAFAVLKNHYGSITKISEVTGTAISNIRYYLRINDLPDEVKNLIREGKIRSYHLSAELTRIQDESRIIETAKYIYDKKLEIGREIIRYIVKNPSKEIVYCVNKVLDDYREGIDVSIFVFNLDEIFEKIINIAYKKEKIKNMNDMFNKKYSIDNMYSVTYEDNDIIVIIKKEDINSIMKTSNIQGINKNIIKEVLVNLAK